MYSSLFAANKIKLHNLAPPELTLRKLHDLCSTIAADARVTNVDDETGKLHWRSHARGV